MIEENHENTPVKLVGTGIWTRDLPNAIIIIIVIIIVIIEPYSFFCFSTEVVVKHKKIPMPNQSRSFDI